MFRFRPEDENEFWTDNWYSNSLAFLSKRFLPTWCQTEQHWTVSFMDRFWTDCACCLFNRGIVAGFVISSILWALIAAALTLLVL